MRLCGAFLLVRYCSALPLFSRSSPMARSILVDGTATDCRDFARRISPIIRALDTKPPLHYRGQNSYFTTCAICSDTWHVRYGKSKWSNRWGLFVNAGPFPPALLQSYLITSGFPVRHLGGSSCHARCCVESVRRRRCHAGSGCAYRALDRWVDRLLISMSTMKMR